MLQNQDGDDDEMLTINVNDSPEHSINDDRRTRPDQNDMKNRCFNIFPSILRKQYFKYKTTTSKFVSVSSNGKKHHHNNHHHHYCYSFDSSNDHSSSSSPSFPITDKCLIPGSPISPRVKNFNLDMKILVLSRNDNPYLSRQIERSNSLTSCNEYDHEEYFLEPLPATPIFGRRRPHGSSQRSFNRFSFSNSRPRNIYGIGDSNVILDDDNEDQKNLHERLIRSPPPNFPEKLSHFLFNENLIAEDYHYPTTTTTTDDHIYKGQ